MLNAEQNMEEGGGKHDQFIWEGIKQSKIEFRGSKRKTTYVEKMRGGDNMDIKVAYLKPSFCIQSVEFQMFEHR